MTTTQQTIGAEPAARSATSTDRHARAKWLWAGLWCLVALGLRFLGTRGDLCQDEIWTLDLIRTVHSPLGIFLDISADNNHFLNSLYLYFVGPDAAPAAMRALSVALGGATVIAAAAAAWRRSWTAYALAVAGFGCAYPMVHYGSEARGYAGFILFTIVSFHLTAREMKVPDRRNRIWLGVSNLLGALFQPIMLGTVAVLFGWTAWTQWRRLRDIRKTWSATERVFSISIRLLLAALLVAVVAVYRVGGYKILATEAFSATRFADAYGGMLRFSLGLPQHLPGIAVFAVLLPVIALALYLEHSRLGERAGFYALAIIGLPLVLFCSRMPNLGNSRYYLLPAVALLFLLAELFGLAWSRGSATRILAVILALGLGVGNGMELARFFAAGRGHYQQALRDIAASGRTTVTGNLAGVTSTVLGYYSRRDNLPVTVVPATDCGTKADWAIENTDFNADHPDAIVIGAPDCPRHYVKQAEYPYWGLTGWYWTLYRAAD